MSRPADVAALARLHALHEPSSEAQAKALPEISDALVAKLETLRRDPTPWGCEEVACNLEGARRAVMRLREALLRDQSPPDAA